MPSSEPHSDHEVNPSPYPEDELEALANSSTGAGEDPEEDAPPVEEANLADQLAEAPLQRMPLRIPNPTEVRIEALFTELEQEQNAWTYLNRVRDEGMAVEDRVRFYEPWIILVSPRPEAERDQLIEQGRQVFRGIRAETMRMDILRHSVIGSTITTTSIVQDDLMAEVVLRQETPRLQYVVYRDAAPDHVDFQFALQIGDVYYHIPQSPWLENGSISLPTGVEEYGDSMALVSEMQAFIDHYLQIEPTLRDVMVVKIFESWVPEAFNSIGYTRFSGDFSSGKSRALDVCRVLMRRTLLLAGITPATLFRFMDRYRGALVLDEADINKNEEASQLLQTVLNVGYKRGVFIPRMEKRGPEGMQETMFDPYGPKVLGTRREYESALESRCITLSLPVLREEDLREGIPFQLPAAFKVEAQVLQNKMLLWRFRNHRSLTFDPAERIGGLEPRLNEIVLPLLTIIRVLTEETGSVWEKEVIGYFQHASQVLRDERGESWEGTLVEALANRWASRRQPDRVPLSEIIDRIKQQHPEMEMHPKRAAGILRKTFKLDVRKVGGMVSVFITEQQITRLCQSYGVSIRCPVR